MNNNNSTRFSLAAQVNSFKYAFNGIKILITEEHNSRIHLFAALSAIILGAILQINTLEWIGIILSIGLVLALEIINSAIESISDYVSEEKHELIKKTKDLAASGVLIASITALSIGATIFIPRIIELFA